MAAISVTAANVQLVSGSSRQVTYGATITAGLALYKDTADSNKYKASRANAAGTGIVDGIALTGGSSGQPGIVALNGAVVNIGGTAVVGEMYGGSDAVAGQIIPWSDYGSGDYVCPVGVGITSANIKLIFANPGVAHG